MSKSAYIQFTEVLKSFKASKTKNKSKILLNRIDAIVKSIYSIKPKTNEGYELKWEIIDHISVYYIYNCHIKSIGNAIPYILLPDNIKKKISYIIIELIFYNIDPISKPYLYRSLFTGQVEIPNHLKDTPGLYWTELVELFNELDNSDKTSLLRIDQEVINLSLIEDLLAIYGKKSPQELLNISIDTDFIAKFDHQFSYFEADWKTCYRIYTEGDFTSLATSLKNFSYSLDQHVINRKIDILFSYLILSRKRINGSIYTSLEIELYLLILFKIIRCASLFYPLYDTNKYFTDLEHEFFVESVYRKNTIDSYKSNFLNYIKLAFYNGEMFTNKVTITETILKPETRTFEIINTELDIPQIIDIEKTMTEYRRLYFLRDTLGTFLAFEEELKIKNKIAELALPENIDHRKKLRYIIPRKEQLPLGVSGDIIIDSQVGGRNPFTVKYFDYKKEYNDKHQASIVFSFYIQYQKMPGVLFRVHDGFIMTKRDSSFYEITYENTKYIIQYVQFLYRILGYIVTAGTAGPLAALIDIETDIALDMVVVDNTAMQIGIGVLTGNFVPAKKFNVDWNEVFAKSEIKAVRAVDTSMDALENGIDMSVRGLNNNGLNAIGDDFARRVDEDGLYKIGNNSDLRTDNPSIAPQTIDTNISKLTSVPAGGYATPLGPILHWAYQISAHNIYRSKIIKKVKEIEKRQLATGVWDEMDVLRKKTEDILSEIKSDKLTFKIANEKLGTILTKSKELSGELYADEVVAFMKGKIKYIGYVPTRGKHGPPILDRLYYNFSTKKYIIIEAKGGTRTKLGEVNRRIYDGSDKFHPTSTQVEQASGEWVFQRIMEIAQKDKELAKKIFEHARRGDIEMIVTRMYDPKDVSDKVREYFIKQKYKDITSPSFDADAFFAKI